MDRAVRAAAQAIRSRVINSSFPSYIEVEDYEAIIRQHFPGYEQLREAAKEMELCFARKPVTPVVVSREVLIERIERLRSALAGKEE